MNMMQKVILGLQVCAFLLVSLFATSSVRGAEEEKKGWKDRFSLGNRLHVSGYGNVHYMDHSGVPRIVGKSDLNEGFFQAREFSLFLDYQMSTNVVVSTEISAANDFKDIDVGYLYFDFDISSMMDVWDPDRLGNLTLRAGRILIPFLSYNENKPNFKQNLMSQPFTACLLSPVINGPPEFDTLGWSDTGILLNWNHPMGPGVFDLKFTAIEGLGSDKEVLDADYIQLATPIDTFNPAIRSRDGLNHRSTGSAGWFDDNNSEPAFTAKATYLFNDQPFDFGVSWYSGNWDNAGDENLEMYGVHFNWLARRWTLKGEYAKAAVEQTAGINVVPLPGPNLINDSTGDYHMDSWYVEGSYIPFFYGEEETRFLRVVARYDEVDSNDKAVFTPWDRSRVTLGLEWQFMKNARLRFEHQEQTLDDFDHALAPFISAGGRGDVAVDMVSLIFWF
ncbi:MAG: hypothetical protein JKY51_10940 [Opitutaceae bacterium]|nr:hypothetical protein [Opitutaceae bacterium]